MPLRPLNEMEVARIVGERADVETVSFLYSISRGNTGAVLALAEDAGLRRLFNDVKDITRQHMAERSYCSPTWLADRVIALGEKFPVEEQAADGEESKASRSRRGVIAVLDVALTELRRGMLDAAAAGRTREMALMRDRIEALLETIKAVSGMANQSLAVEGMALRMAELNSGESGAA